MTGTANVSRRNGFKNAAGRKCRDYALAMEKRTRLYRKVRFEGEGGREWRVVGSVLFASCSRRGPSARAGNKFVSKSAFVALCALRVRGTRGKKRAAR